jgi:predicted O-methyltransferase YrrM
MNKIKKAWHILTHEGFRPFFVRLKEFYILWKKRIIRILVYPYASWKLRREAIKKHSVHSAVDLIFKRFGQIFTPQQVQSEISDLCEIIEKAKPEIVLEIGTATGGSLFLFSRFASPDANIVSIDLPKGPSGGFYTNMAESLYKKFKSPLQEITLLRKDSHNKETIELLKKITKNKEIDFLFIDGDHSYGGVKQDYELYSPLVKKGGIIAFHDICKCLERCDVGKFWDEVKVGKNYKELIENCNQNWAGIGVIFT